MDIPLQTLDQIRVTAIDIAFRFGPKLLVAVLILVAGYVVYSRHRIVRRHQLKARSSG